MPWYSACLLLLILFGTNGKKGRFSKIDGTRIDDNVYLSILENGTELIVCTEEQIQKLLIYFELKRYLGLKNISYPLYIGYFLWYSK